LGSRGSFYAFGAGLGDRLALALAVSIIALPIVLEEAHAIQSARFDVMEARTSV